MAIIEQTGAAILDPLAKLWISFVNAFPGLIAAIVVVLIGWVVGLIIGYVVSKILEHTKIDVWIKKEKLHGAIGHLSISHLFGLISKWYVFAVFLAPAASLVKLGTLSDLFLRFAQWFPNLIIAVVILVFGLLMSEVAKNKMDALKSRGMKAISSLVKIIIILFVALIALSQIGVNVVIAENVVLLIVGGIALGLAIALGIGFGDAFKAEAKNWIKSLKK